jgi:hypothetical protein
MAVRLPAIRVRHPYPQEQFLVLVYVRGWVDSRAIVRLQGLGKSKNSNDLIGNRARNLPACSIVPQPTTPFLYFEDKLVINAVRNIISNNRNKIEGLYLLGYNAVMYDESESTFRSNMLSPSWTLFLTTAVRPTKNTELFLYNGFSKTNNCYNPQILKIFQ